jgi:hypothetical protein
MKRLISLFEIMILLIGVISFSVILSPVVNAEETELGCCYDREEGICTPNSLEENCLENEESSWLQDGKCEVPECNLGCCYLGLEAQFITEQRCSFLSSTLGTPKKWDGSIREEMECVASLENEESGACVISQGNSEENLCKFTTRQECMQLTRDSNAFHKGFLCSNPTLNTVCERQQTASCANGRDGVYWFDSCGNRENIYSSNREGSWNNGKVLAKEQSCNPNSNNANSVSCGNCDYGLGSVCGEFREGEDRGNFEGYTCRDLNCYNAPDHAGRTKDRINGESWCIYDGQIGERTISLDYGDTKNEEQISVDTVGSGHYRVSCVNGEVEVEPCADYRKEICVEDTAELENGREIDNAFCRVNLWEQCITYNTQSTSGGCDGICLDYCDQNPDCRLHNVEVDDKFKFNICVPKYPPGFDLGINLNFDSTTNNLNEQFGTQFEGFQDIVNQGGSSAMKNQICNMGELTCPVVWVKKLSGWKCEENCDCQTDEFTEQMNNLCVSLGDCGAYVNWVGEFTDRGGHVTKKGSKGGIPMQPGNLSDVYLQFAQAISSQFATPGFYNNVEAVNNLPTGLNDPFGSNYNQLEVGELPEPGLFSSDNWGTTAMAGAAGGAVAGFLFGGFGGAAAGSISTGLYSAFGGFNPMFWNPYTVAIGVAIAIAITQFLGIGKTKIIEVTYHCDEWQLPYNYNDCEKCNEDPYIPCTSYRCESLGARCGMINEGSEFGKCVDQGGQDTIPVITPWEEILNESFKYQDVSTNGFRIRTNEGECIQAFTPLIFGVETDIYAQCRISQDPSFNENWNWFLEGELFTTNHTYATYLPSVESLLWSEVENAQEYEEIYERVQRRGIDSELVEELGLGEEMEGFEGDSIYEFLLNKVGDLDYYVKCNNIFGRENDHNYLINFCVSPGPDLTPPFIGGEIPENGATIRLDAEEQDVIIFVNEPVDCKWANEKPTSTNMAEVFEGMENSFECNQDSTTGNLIGFQCVATLPTPEEENDYYFLCRDQPWLGESEERNYGGRAGSYFEYNLKKTKDPLEITKILPSGTITSGQDPVKIELKVETVGGIDNGNAQCRYEFENRNFRDIFLTTGNNRHIQELNVEEGEYKVNIYCEDVVGNKANNFTEFKIELDTIFPEVARVYNDGGQLKIITTEDATCFYEENSLVDCNFDLKNSSIMQGANSRIHGVDWNSNNIYYIICEDIWGNKPDECSIIAKPEDIIR